MAHYRSLRLAALPARPRPPSLPSLAAAFVASLDAHHPSATTTILRTACKLQVHPGPLYACACQGIGLQLMAERLKHRIAAMHYADYKQWTLLMLMSLADD